MKDNEELIPEQTASEPSNTPLMWMHITWLPTIMPIVPLLVWGFICQRKPQAWKHLKNILNASFTFILFHTVSLFSFVGLMVALISFGFIEGKVWWHPLGVSYYSENPIPGIGFFAIYMSALVCVIVSIVFVSMAARKGQVLPYWWAIRFFRIT